MKLLIKLLIVGLVANAAWHLLTVYTAHYRFADAVEESALHGTDLSDGQLQQRVIDLMAQFDIPADADSFTVKREPGHTIAGGAYTRTVELAPGFSRRWPFSWHVDVMTMPSLKPK